MTYRSWLAALGVASIASSAVAEESPFPPQSYLTPPYDSLAFGDPAALPKGMVRMPRPQDGEAVAFFLTREGAIRTIACPAPQRIAVSPSRTTIALTDSRARGQFAIVSDRRAMASVALQSSLKGAKAARAIDAARRQGTLAASVGGRTVGSAEASGLMTTRDSRRAVSETKEQRGLHSSAQGRRMGVAGAAGGLTEERSRREMSGMAARGGIRSSSSVQLLRYFSRDGRLMSLLDQDFLDRIIDESIMLGFFDEDNQAVVSDADYAFAAMRDEFSALVAAYDSDLQPLHYLDGQLTARFRRDAPLAEPATYEADVDCRLAPRPLHHGGPLVVDVSIRNTGTMPLFDLLLLSAPPEHTRFIGGPDRTPGYALATPHNADVVLTRLFRPVKPGETFRIMMFFATDRWVLEQPPEDPQAASSS